MVCRKKGVIENPLEKNTRMCPVCGGELLKVYEICGCGWQNDSVQFYNPDWGGCANRMSLNEARKAYAEGRPIE